MGGMIESVLMTGSLAVVFQWQSTISAPSGPASVQLKTQSNKTGPDQPHSSPTLSALLPPTLRRSSGIQKTPQRLTDHLGGRRVLGFCALKELVAQLGIHLTDSTLAGAEPRAGRPRLPLRAGNAST